MPLCAHRRSAMGLSNRPRAICRGGFFFPVALPGLVIAVGAMGMSGGAQMSGAPRVGLCPATAGLIATIGGYFCVGSGRVALFRRKTVQTVLNLLSDGLSRSAT